MLFVLWEVAVVEPNGIVPCVFVGVTGADAVGDTVFAFGANGATVSFTSSFTSSLLLLNRLKLYAP